MTDAEFEILAKELFQLARENGDVGGEFFDKAIKELRIMRKQSNRWEVLAEAEKVFGSFDLAMGWLQKKNKALANTPISLLDTDNGVGEVLKLLSAIANGGVV